jgi:hypothetical protein
VNYPTVAVMVVVPGAMAVSFPALETVATAVLLELQRTVLLSVVFAGV